MIENETAGASKVAEMVDESQPTQELSSTPDDTSQHTDDTSEGTDDTQESPSEQPDDSQNGAGPALVEPARDPAAEATSNIRAATKGQHAEKNDDDDLSPFIDVQLNVVKKTRAVFVPSIDYLQHLDTLTENQRVWVVAGSPQSGKFTCALHLGLALLRQGRPLDRDLYRHTSGTHQDRRLDEYAQGIRLLRQRITDRKSVSEGMLEEDELELLLILEGPLFDNLSTVQRGGDNENLRSDRYRMLGDLNILSLKYFSMNFHDVCRWTESQDASVDEATILRSLPVVKIFRRDTRTGRTLLDILQGQSLAEPTIYITERAFENGVSQSELSSDLQAHLESKNSYLILTTERTEQALSTLSVPRISTRFTGTRDEVQNCSQVFLRAVLRSNLEYYVAKDGLPEDLRLKAEDMSDQVLRDVLGHPFTIDIFCMHLRSLPDNASAEAIAELADQVGKLDREATRSWFRNLSENERLYALLVYLFDGVERYLVDELYTMSVRYLRQDGVGEFRDPRAMGLSDIRDHVRAHLNEMNTIQFNNPALVEEARRQVDNYHHILWSLCEHVFRPLIDVYRASRFGPFRQSLGAAIGRMGVYHREKLVPLLDGLAAHESGGVAATAGYILDTVVRTKPELCGWAAGRIRSWAYSQVPDPMWAAAAAIWRVYDGIAEIASSDDETSATTRSAADALESLRQSLNKLATNPDQFREDVIKQVVHDATEAAEKAIDQLPENQRSQSQVEDVHLAVQLTLAVQLQQWIAMIVDGVHYALLQLSRKHAADIVTLVSDWLHGSPTDKQHVVGELAVQRLIMDTITQNAEQSETARLIIERHQPLLDLVEPMLSADRETIQDILRTLRYWVQQDGWDQRVHKALLITVARATNEYRAQLADLIAEEWAGGDATIDRIAHSVVARARLLDGVPVDVYSGDQGVILVDSTHPARRRGGMGTRLARLVDINLAAMIPIVTRALGFVQPRPKLTDGASPAATLAPISTPRLMVPVLERCLDSESLLVLVLTWGPILDLEDTYDGPWSAKLLIGALGTTPELPEAINRVVVPLRFDQQATVNQVVEAARVHVIRHLAKRDAATWWQQVSPLLQLETPDLALTDEQLEAWIADLEQPYMDPSADPLRALIATTCWLATADLEQCVKRLTAWIARDDACSQQAGLATARALLYLFGSADPVPHVETHSALLQLVMAQRGQGWASARAFLYAAQRWGRVQAWVDRMLSPPDGSPSEILQFVDALSTEDRTRFTQELATWSQAPAGEDELTTTQVAYLAEQIKLRIALGIRASLPALGNGEFYGILVVDTSTTRLAIRSTLAQTASLAVRQLRWRYGASIQTLIYRMGQDYPLAGPTEQPKAEVIAPVDGGAPPRLIGPLLDRLPPDHVRFVVLLTAQPSHDLEDWYESAWCPLIHVYTPARQVMPALGAIPFQANTKAGGEAIVEYLMMHYPPNEARI